MVARVKNFDAGMPCLTGETDARQGGQLMGQLFCDPTAGLCLRLGSGVGVSCISVGRPVPYKFARNPYACPTAHHVERSFSLTRHRFFII